jgi:hypothetical protein
MEDISLRTQRYTSDTKGGRKLNDDVKRRALAHTHTALRGVWPNNARTYPRLHILITKNTQFTSIESDCGDHPS